MFSFNREYNNYDASRTPFKVEFDSHHIGGEITVTDLSLGGRIWFEMDKCECAEYLGGKIEDYTMSDEEFEIFCFQLESYLEG